MADKDLNEEVLEEELEGSEETAGAEEEVTAEETANEAGDEAEASGDDEASEGEEADGSDKENKAGPDGDKDKKKLFKKNKKDKKDEQIEQLTDRVKRQMAEFENFRKRTEKEKSSMYEMGARSVIEKMLPVIDNFERGLDTVPEDEKDSPFTEGMRMIYKQLMTELEGIGVKPIEALGAEFDPEFHNAVMQVESEEYESGHVAQELQKGYMYRDSVVRHSMVAVVQ
ncbi:MAG: nucleotide exchange factor GrpE [Lachnospiraceae bacterium]|nr:nucleotide exchange factor GrpE [Lachnospiraceae bacterium]